MYTHGSNMNSFDIKYDYEQHLEKTKKRSRRVLSLKERIEVIKIAETRRDTRELAMKFECGRTQILSILSQKDRLLREWANNGDPNRLRRRPSPLSQATNKVMYEWLYRCRRAQLTLTDSDIIEKAFEAKHFFKYGEFRPNRRWLDRFKRKFKLDQEQLITADPTFYDGVERSLELKDIYDDIKHTLRQDPSIDLLKDELPDFDSILSNDQTMSSSNDICELEDSDDDGAYLSQNFDDDICSTSKVSLIKTEEETPIANDQEALECLKKLEEYSMLKDNFRAIGLIVQLEKIYKGEAES